MFRDVADQSCQIICYEISVTFNQIVQGQLCYTPAFCICAKNGMTFAPISDTTDIGVASKSGRS